MLSDYLLGIYLPTSDITADVIMPGGSVLNPIREHPGMLTDAAYLPHTLPVLLPYFR